MPTPGPRVLVPDPDPSAEAGAKVEAIVIEPYYKDALGRGRSTFPTGYFVELPDGRRRVYFLAQITARPLA